MKKTCLIASLLLLGACASNPPDSTTAAAATETSDAQALRLPPPIAKQVPHIIKTPHGERSDPYFWLRDDTRKNPDMLAFLEAENAYTSQYFKPLEPLKEKLFAEIKGRIKEDDSSVPVLEDGYWYYTRFETGKQYNILARRKGTMNAGEEVLIDGNARSTGKSFYQRPNFEVSEDGRWMAVVEDFVGRRQFELRFYDTRNKSWLPQSFANVDASLAISNDNETVFFVEKDPTTLLPFRVKRYRIGSDTASAQTVYEEKDNTFYTSVYRDKSDRMLVLYLGSTLTTEMRFLDAEDADGAFQVFLPRETGHEYQVNQLGNDFVIRSNWQAPNFRLFRAPIAAGSNKLEWRELVASNDDVYIDDVELFSDRIAIGQRSQGLRKIRMRSLVDGSESFIEASEPSYTMTLVSTPNLASGKMRYAYTSMSTPSTVYELDFKTGVRTQLKQEPVLGGFESGNYQTEFVWADARDGVKVPVSLVYRRGFGPANPGPLFIRAYGSYGFSSDPAFSSATVSLLDRGFVVATAHIRGGQELGRQWYEDGKLLKKKNTFYDFIDVTQFLVARGYGKSDEVFAQGGSAGGLLMGAVINLAPELYRGVIANVPFVDVMSTMEDASLPLTTGEYDEWGNPANKQYYDYMLSYSPYDNVRAADYPNLFVTTGLWDSQVQYFEPAKWVAKLRANKTGDNVLLLKTNMEAGHGGKSGRFQRLEEVAQEYAFLLSLLGRSE